MSHQVEINSIVIVHLYTRGVGLCWKDARYNG